MACPLACVVIVFGVVGVVRSVVLSVFMSCASFGCCCVSGGVICGVLVSGVVVAGCVPGVLSVRVNFCLFCSACFSCSVF